MKVISIAAVGKNGVIGKGSELPWNIPEDMKFFMDSTRNHIVLMGRKTYDALGKALPKRENAVITRDATWSKPDAKVFHRLEDAIQFYQKEFLNSGKTIFVIGGAEIYRLAIPLVDEIWLTEITQSFDGDVFFPCYGEGVLKIGGFKLKLSEPQTDKASTFTYHFNRYLKEN